MELLKRAFNSSNDAFIYFYDKIIKNGINIDDTKTLFNIGFYIKNPTDNEIKVKWRRWNKNYAELEWKWYLSLDRSVAEIKKYAKIWDKMHNGDNIVNSNYGYQWSRGKQLDYIVKELIKNPNSRRAVLTIYDGKEHSDYKLDTPCTLNVVFNIVDKKLNMTVLMRSNDLVYGFCNDQYCFSKLQKFIADILEIKVGWYYHFANNLHIYKKHFKMKEVNK